jgi:hypothetical protein
MVGNDQWYTVQLVLPATHSAYSLITCQQILSRNSADRENNFRPYQLDLAFQISTARSRLLRPGITVVRRPALQNIGDEYRVPALPDGAQHFVKQLAGSANEWLTAPILFGARRLANNQPVCARVADTEDGVRATLRQVTKSAAFDAALELGPVQATGQVTPQVSLGHNFGVRRISGQPDIDAHRPQVGTSLMFRMDHAQKNRFFEPGL